MAKYIVGDDGNAPKGLKPGDEVITHDGTYTIWGINDDGTYVSDMTDANTNTSYMTDYQKQWLKDNPGWDTRAGGGGSGGGGGSSSAMDLINQQKKYLMDAAREQNDVALSSLASAEAKLPGYYADVKNQAAASSAQNKQAFNTVAAARGLNSGTYGQAEVSRLNTLGNAYTAADREMAGKKADLDQKRAELAANWKSVSAQIEANALSQQQAQANADRQFEYSKQRDAMSDKMAMLNYTDNKANQQKQDFLSTIGAYSNDYQAQINALQNDGDTTNDWQIPYLQAARQDKIAGINASDAEYQKWLAEQELAWYRATKGSGGGSGGYEPKLTYSQVVDAIKKGNITPQVLSDYQYYNGTQYGQETQDTSTTGYVSLGGNAQQLYTALASARRYGSTPDDIIKSIAQAVDNGQISDAEAQVIINNLGL